MLIAELDVNAAMNAPVTQEDMAVALIKRMKHAFEVPQFLHDPGSASAMQRFSVSAILVLIDEADARVRRPLPHMTERHLSKYVSSTLANSCDSFSAFAEAQEVTEAFIRLIAAIERCIKPDDFAADQYGGSDSTFSDDHAGPSIEVPELATDFVDAEPLEEADVSSASPHFRWAQFVTE
eukprot:4364185-Pleurochrysis_carterae.AAC.1